jgi:hypothetical protein
MRTSDGVIHAASVDLIRVGDVVEVWHDRGYSLGAVQSPPGTPAYSAKQLVIDR